MKYLTLLVAFFVLSISLYASAPVGRCGCGATWNCWTHYHPDCTKFPQYRGKVKSLATPYIPKVATQEDILKRAQQLDAAYRAKFPCQPEDSYPKY